MCEAVWVILSSARSAFLHGCVDGNRRSAFVADSVDERVQKYAMLPKPQHQFLTKLWESAFKIRKNRH